MAFSPDDALRLITSAHQHDRLAHAFLIYGPDGGDLVRLANGIATLVNGWTGLETLDDLRKHGAWVIEPESKLRRIRIAQMREVEKRLQFTSTAEGRKLVIIHEADRMMPEAANAFLKTLEEPPPDTLILLLTRSVDQLLDTIRSRCVRVPLFRSAAHGLELTTAQAAFVTCLGQHFTSKTENPLGLLRDFQSILAGLRSEIEDEHDALLKEEQDHYGKATDGVWLKDRKDHYEDLTESRYQEQRNGLLALLFTWFGEILRRQQGLPALDLPGSAATTERLATTLPAPEVHRRLRAVEELRRNLATNVREPLALEVGFLNAFSPA